MAFSSLRSALPLFAAALSVVACGALEMSSEEPGTSAPNNNRSDDPINASATDGGSSGGSSGAASGGMGGGTPWSPLCGAPSGSCLPDDPLPTQACGTAESEEPEPPSREEDSPAEADDEPAEPASPNACRVAVEGNSRYNVCSDAGKGAEGTTCRRGDDCAAGLECARSDAAAGEGVCRAYCCEGVCEGTEGAKRVCSPSPRTEDRAMVPLCVPFTPCTLFGSECGANETCAVVRESDGQTGCVAVGPSQIGESCDSAPCAAGLTCLGRVGARSCFQLCSDSAGAVCPREQECTWAAPTFSVAGTGICLDRAQGAYKMQ